MSESATVPAKTRLLVSIEEALDRARRFGKSMVAFSRSGTTHERIGVIERVERDADGIRLSGTHHASRIMPSAVASIEVDRSNKMKDTVYPRLDFRDASGQAVFAVVGFEGLLPFDAALAGCKEEALPALEPEPKLRPMPAANAATPVPLPFDALQIAQQSGAEVMIRHGMEGFTQEWRGRVGQLKPAMGFLNIIDPDFHLHLKDGSLSAWQQEKAADDSNEITFVALDTDGKPTGLTISGPASAFTTSGR